MQLHEGRPSSVSVFCEYSISFGRFLICQTERFLDEDEWAAFQDAIELMPKETNVEKDAYERACFIAALMFYLAPRASELASSRMNSFRKLSGKWWWHVIGKGSKVAEIPANDGMINAVIRYRTHLGLDSPLPLSDDETPLLRSIKDGHAITTRQLNRIQPYPVLLSALQLSLSAGQRRP